MGQPSDIDSPAVATVDAEPGVWNQELSERLYRLLYQGDESESNLNARIESLLAQFGDSVFSELIFLLTHLRFKPAEARDHWTGILKHRETLSDRIESGVDLRVALVSYFVHINRQFDNPKVIELRLFEQTQASAYRDELTGLFNYRAFREHLEREVSRSLRRNAPLSLLMIDVDDFKIYNDSRGHDAGNDLLATLARVIKRSVRKIDLPSRYGGEEFAIVLPETFKSDAVRVAEIVRSRVESHRFAVTADEGESASVTVSVGVAACPGDADSGAELVRCADRAMYGAKSRGKNCVSLYGEDRRSFQRWETELEGSFGTLESTRHPFRTINVSEGGMQVRTETAVSAGAVVDASLKLGDNRNVVALGRVTNVVERDGNYEVRIRFVDLPWEDRMLLAQHLRKARNSE